MVGRYDVVVIGGGTGGAPAGIGAARQGAKTLVVEYLHGLGGVGTITSFGLVVGPIVASYLYQGVAPQAPFFFAGALIAANALFITFVFRDHHERNRYQKDEYRIPYYIPKR